MPDDRALPEGIVSGGPDFPALQARLASARGQKRAAAVGELLAAIGAALRTGQAPPNVAIQSEDVASYLGSVDPAAIREELARAAEAAVEAALAETDAERAEWESWAIQGLRSRDALDCALLAADRVIGPEVSRARERLERELAGLDAQAPGLSRWLVGINAQRRKHRETIASEHRERVWWFCARADCDALVAMWRDAELNAQAAHCEDCASDLKNARLAARPPSRCVSTDELWEFDTGALSPARRRRVQLHARDCGECALALAALEVSPDEPAADNIPDRATGAPQILASRPEFQVLLLRAPRRVRIAPAPGQRLAAAALHGAGVVQARTVSGGLELSAGKGPQRLRVELADGRRVELELDL